MNVGERLKRLREERGLTLEEVGAKIGTAKQTVYKYEQGIVSNIPLSKIELLAQLYAADPAYIMGWESAAPAHDAATRRLAAAYASINAEGKERVASYAEDLSHSGNYKLSASISIEEEAAQYISVIGSAAAGAGFAYTVREDLYDELYEEIESLLVQIARGGGIADRRTLPFIYELDRREERSLFFC